ncbi:MAG: TIGR00159 family protein [Planctomycetes bacterium RIFCSPHIGHO2_02_FULL_50_42]|nr:MAG: TIGR00159 family protein [Planctomycetes bacterium GWA2_50_13]OHB87246.1 MAG: TIGR00159 family protein [Planctomycetes bacterium RIFCSPHIGHO2_02_FULL_50_42]OHB91632.1 MAG: TIGR00159 family protein [Planctomycetes bacterium RIFCSPHIGHO2_12_FULL_51_37]OHB96282.1 MAG: TIGR00159 family protein [Planctomycetes bacterium RIFCSPLOWO2_02_FULL_50_16]OHC04545.1 MAG: TIGR00159 family protein [Planctomycetes bacterium RIFCSPLOWO2_12_FULL_50_35]HCN18957.1 TIGR00159 family protein [Planctomycetia ba
MESFFEDVDFFAAFKAAVEIFIIFLMLYFVLRFMQGTRGVGVMRGMVFVLVVATVILLLIVRSLQLYTVDWLLTEFVPMVTIPFIILFQPELRRALVRLGENPFLEIFFKGESPMLNEVVTAASVLSKNRLGGLIAIERKVGLDHFVEAGTRLDANISSALINTIFWPGSPLHDGAVIIQEQKIVAAGCLLPLSDNPTMDKTFGTRHRAGLGITEETDAISIIVSEETGVISLAVKGQITSGLDENSLRKRLEQLFKYDAVNSGGEGLAQRDAVQ